MQIINVIEFISGSFSIQSFAVSDEQESGLVRQEVENFCCELLSKFSQIEEDDIEFDDYFVDDRYDDGYGHIVQILNSYVEV